MTADRKRVLVTGAGGPAAVGLIRSWNQRSDVEVLAGDIDPVAAGLYLVGRDRSRLLLRGDDPSFVDHTLRLCADERIDVVVPTVDSELLPLARRAPEFRAAGVELVVAPVTALEACLDKAALARRCEGAVPVPRTAIIDQSFALSDWQLPFIAKPRSGSGSRDVSLISDPADLDAVPKAGEFIAQAYLPGAEYSIDVLIAPDGRVVASVPRSRLKVDSGISVAGRTHHHPELEALGGRAAAAVGLVGVANVQARCDRDGRPALLEINPRFPGAMVLTVAAGADLPNLVLDAALGRDLPGGPVAFREVGIVRFWEDEVVSVEDLGTLEPPRPVLAGMP